MTEPEPILTSVEGKQGQPLSLDLFADITEQQVIGWSADGVLFAGELTDEEVGDVWWRYTSRDAVDEAQRRAIAAMVAANDPNLCIALANHVLGMEA